MEQEQRVLVDLRSVQADFHLELICVELELLTLGFFRVHIDRHQRIRGLLAEVGISALERTLLSSFKLGVASIVVALV
jgi:hypothetical protein